MPPVRRERPQAQIRPIPDQAKRIPLRRRWTLATPNRPRRRPASAGCRPGQSRSRQSSRRPEGPLYQASLRRESDLEYSIREEMEKPLKPFVKPAEGEHREAHEASNGGFPTVGVIGKAGVALISLNRAKKYSDGKRAYNILWAYVEQSIMDCLCWSKDDWDALVSLHNYSKGPFATKHWEGIRKAYDE